MRYHYFFSNLAFIFSTLLSVPVFSSFPDENEKPAINSTPSLKAESTLKPLIFDLSIQESISQSPLQLLRAKVQAHETNGNLLAAAQKMNHLLNLT